MCISHLLHTSLEPGAFQLINSQCCIGQHTDTLRFCCFTGPLRPQPIFLWLHAFYGYYELKNTCLDEELHLMRPTSSLSFCPRILFYYLNSTDLFENNLICLHLLHQNVSFTRTGYIFF